MNLIIRGEYMNEIMKGLSLLQYYIKFSSNKLGLHDINKHCESFFCGLFNILWDTNFERLENTKKNFPSIDLADDTSMKAMQITSNGSKQKLENTITKFEENKLYKKYDLLYHFIIGEKHYPTSKSHQTMFEKKSDLPSNIYFKDKKINNNTYQIQIIDMLDLITLIDASNNSTVNDIHEYIISNIEPTLNNFKKKLYPIESNEITPFTAKKYIEYLGIETTELQSTFYDDLKKFADTLNSLDENNRRFLYKILENYSINTNMNEDITIYPGVIQRLLKLDDTTLFTDINLLKNVGIIDDDALEYDGIIKINYYDSENEEIINELCKYCSEKNISLFDIIVNLNFPLLD